MSAHAMPVQKPGRSKQDYGTPWELIHAVEKRWGRLSIDLAASETNAKAPLFISAEDDYLKQPVGPELKCGLSWCNPPFENLAPWADKWRLDSQAGARIIALTPASVGANWFANSICRTIAGTGIADIRFARVITLSPRITFEGCTDPYPKDCMLTLWGIDEPGFEFWRWK